MFGKILLHDQSIIKFHISFISILLVVVGVSSATEILDNAVIYDNLFRKSIVDVQNNFEMQYFSYNGMENSKVGSVLDTKNAYFKIRLKFKPMLLDNYPNVFQTGPTNKGARLELDKDDAQLIVGMGWQNDVVHGFQFPKKLVQDHWYLFDMEIKNGHYLKASLDAVPFLTYTGADVNVNFSDIRLGGGFDNSRNFIGDIKEARITMGNIDPWISFRSLFISYLLPIGLVFSGVVIFISYAPLIADIRLLLIKLLLFSLPVISILLYFEFRLTPLQTVYLQKRIEFERSIKFIDTIILGSSNAFYGINPDEFQGFGYNLAFPGNGMQYDARMIEKFSRRTPNLKNVIFTINYYTLGTPYESFSQQFRSFATGQYFGIDSYVGNNSLSKLLFWLEPRNFSKIALWGNNVYGLISDNYLGLVDLVEEPNGFYNSGLASVDPSSGFGKNAALNDATLVQVYNKNLSYLDTAISELKKNGVNVYVLILPTDKSYFSNLKIEKRHEMTNIITDFAVKHSILFKDYTGDPRFNEEDFTWELPDHLNGSGARKISKIINSEILGYQ